MLQVNSDISKIIAEQQRLRQQLARFQDDRIDKILESHAQTLSKISRRLRDITSNDSKPDENLAEKFEDIYRMIIEGADFPITIVNASGVLHYANPTAVKNIGSTAGQLKGKSISDIFPDNSQTILDNVRRVIDNNKSETIEEILEIHGKPTWHRSHLQPITINNGKDKAVLIIGHDITKRKQIENDLKQTEEKYRLIVECVGYSIACVDFNGKILFANNYAAQRHDSTPEQMTGLSIRDIFAEDDCPKLLENVRRVITHKKAEIFDEQIKFDGQPIWYRSHIQPVYIDESDGTVALITSNDITQLKNYESNLAESEEKYRLIVEGAGEPIFSVDSEGRFHFMNTLAARQLGGSPEMFIGKTMWDLFPKPHADRQSESIRRVINNHKSETLEGPTTVRGQVRWYRTNIQPLIINNETTKVALVIANDITDSKHAEEALIKSEAMYRNLFEFAGDGLFILDFEGNILDVNQAGCIMHKYTKKQILARHTTDIVHPKEHDKISYYFDSVRNHNTVSIESTHISADGSEFPVEINAVQTLYGDSPAVLCSVRDTTERRDAQKAIKESQARYKFLSDVAFEGILVHQEGAFLDANRNLCEIFGYSEDQLRQLKNIEIIAPECRQEVSEIIQRKSEKTYETIGMKKDGTRINLLVQARNIILNGIQCRVASIRDITAETKMKSELEDYKQKMLQSQRHAYINYTGSIVAHQLNQPLTVINMLLGQIKDDLAKGKTNLSEIFAHIDDCLYESNNTAQIMSKFRQSLNDPSWKIAHHIKLCDSAQKTISALKNRAEHAKLDIETQGLDDLPKIYMNENALEQIFFIIIQNAIEATDGTKQRKLRIKGIFIDNHVMISFKDNCGGIEPHCLEEIFKPFFTTKENKQGMGLGLEIVHRIMITSGGKIKVNNNYGTGAEFVVTLPVK